MSSPTMSMSEAPQAEKVVLVKGPECQGEESGVGAIQVVQSERCHSIDLSVTDSPSPVNKGTTALPMMMFKSLIIGQDNANEREEEEHELVEHPTISQSKPTQYPSSEEGDMSREYGYKYEFSDQAVDGNCCQSSQVEEEEEDELNDESETILEQATYDPLLPLNLSSISYTHTTAPSATTATQLFHNSHISGGPRIYLLGRIYDPDFEYEQKREDELSLFWFTYRCDFPEIVPYRITSDAGWGCMLRSAQMMLAQALRVHFKSRNWRCHRLSIPQRRREPFLRTLLTWMADFPSSHDNIYSLHNMVAAGMAKYEILPGEWYGPGTACYVLRDLVQAHETRQIIQWKKKQELLLQQEIEKQQQKQQEQQNQGQEPATAKNNDHSEPLGPPNRIFRVYVAPQGTVYEDAVRELMTKESRARYQQSKETAEAATGPKGMPDHPLATAEADLTAEQLEKLELQQLSWDTGLLLLIPLRLGLKGINEDYAKSISFTFSIPQSVGALGGRPRGARWFYGAWEDGSKILGLDPHTVQPAPRRRTARINGKSAMLVDISQDYICSVHTASHETVPLLRMDPSMALGFYCQTIDDLRQLQSYMTSWKSQNPNLPELFTFAESSPDYTNGGVSSSMLDDLIAADMAGSSLLDEDDESAVSDEDEYVML